MKNSLYASHFKKVDPKIYGLSLRIKLVEIVKPDSYFERLCRTIIGQQLSGKVARVIFARFTDLFPDGRIDPEMLLKLTDAKIRSVGMSNSKVAFIKDLAAKVVSRDVDLERIDDLTDAKIIEHLTKVHGIGPWSAEMFLIFSLGRPDVFSSGDLGLLRAVEKLYGIKNPSKEKLEKISEKWSPYRSFASRLLWKSLDNEG
ncbi:MAG: DNA-3-methyladenine glycosylase 2 family protein [Candidatus Curtissbacteria bacterium]|nr:DNA-3-methyladenine glycosylase 2 family protein [Candidatus Curtissbacteria bacterium]